MSSLAFVLVVLYISAYSIRCLLSPFPAVSRRAASLAMDSLGAAGDWSPWLCSTLLAFHAASAGWKG